MNYIGVIIFIAVILVAWIGWSYFSGDDALESPEYTVIEKKNGYEIREYQPYIEARVTVPGNLGNATGAAFRLLAGYIFGGNTTGEGIAMTTPVATSQQSSEKIAMTTPVTTSQEGDMMTMSFMMPKKYTLETLPTPDNNQVQFIEVSSGIFAVRQFSGWVGESKRLRHTEKLSQDIDRDGYQSTGGASLLQYNRPFTFPYFRRNEIKVPIAYE